MCSYGSGSYGIVISGSEHCEICVIFLHALYICIELAELELKWEFWKSKYQIVLPLFILSFLEKSRLRFHNPIQKVGKKLICQRSAQRWQQWRHFSELSPITTLRRDLDHRISTLSQIHKLLSTKYSNFVNRRHDNFKFF